MDPIKLREERANLTKKARAIIDKADGEKRSLNSEERAEVDKLLGYVGADGKPVRGEIDRIGDQIASVEGEKRSRDRLAQVEAELKESAGRVVPPTDVRTSNPANHPGVNRDIEYRSTPQYNRNFNLYLLDGQVRSGMGPAEFRDLQADADVIGGYLVAPQQFMDKLIRFMSNLVFIRQKATKYTVTKAQSVGFPSLDTDPADADWTSELATGNDDTAMAFGKRELHPHPVAKLIRISNKLIRLALQSPDDLVMERLAYKFGITEEKAYFSGTGTNQPLGMLVASNAGIPGSQDTVTSAVGQLSSDDLIVTKYSLKAQYQSVAEWFLNRTTVCVVRRFKDAYGQYLWMPGLAGDRPDTLIDRPIYMSEYMTGIPANSAITNNAATGLVSGTYAALLGVYSYYWIVDVGEMTVQRLVELYAATNQVGYIGRLEVDGMPVLGEAFARTKVQ